MSKKSTQPVCSPEVKAFIAVLEKEGGKIEGIDLRIFEDNLFIVCECGNADHSKFVDYLRGGKRDDRHVRCTVCGNTIAQAEVKTKHEALIKSHGRPPSI